MHNRHDEMAGVLDELVKLVEPIPGGKAIIAKVREQAKAAQKKQRDQQMLLWAAVAFFFLTSR